MRRKNQSDGSPTQLWIAHKGSKGGRVSSTGDCGCEKERMAGVDALKDFAESPHGAYLLLMINEYIYTWIFPVLFETGMEILEWGGGAECD